MKSFLLEIPFFSERDKRADVRNGLVMASSLASAMGAAERLQGDARRIYALLMGNDARLVEELAGADGDDLLERAGLWVGAFRVHETTGIPSLDVLDLPPEIRKVGPPRLLREIIAPEQVGPFDLPF